MPPLSRFAHLGADDDHARNLQMIAQSHGIEVIHLPDSLSFAAAGHRPIPRVRRALDQITSTSNPDYLRHVLGTIDGKSISVVLAYWGTGPLPDIRALKRARPHLKSILNLLCHPLGTTRIKTTLQDAILRNSMKHLDGVIVSSEAMGRYIRTRISDKVAIFKTPPYWHSSQFSKVQMLPLKERPNIVFLGRTDWASAQPTDMVERFLLELMDEGIEVYFGRSANSRMKHPNARPFEPLAVDELTTFASQFDAALVTYNIEMAPHSQRFNVTVPDRLITSVAAAIPIAIPDTGFSASAEYLNGYGAVLKYRSAQDLASQLRDRIRVQALRTVAAQNAPLYHGERHFPALLRILSEVECGGTDRNQASQKGTLQK